jgi:hypothetical protein
MQSTTKQTFDTLVGQIQNAIAARDFLSVCDRATELGLLGEKTESSFAVCYRFEGKDSSGATLNLFARSYDPSGPTRVRPRITRFTVTASENGADTMQFEDEYEGWVGA